MAILLTILVVLLALSVIGFVIKTLFWLGVLALVGFGLVVAWGVAKNMLGGGDNRSIRS